MKVKAKEHMIEPAESTIDFKAAFEYIPGSSALLATDAPIFTILAATDDYLQQTGKKKEELIGKGLFEAFPPSPDDTGFMGAKNVTASFQTVMTNKQMHQLPAQRYDITGRDGSFAEYYWRASNKPVLDKKGNVLYIIHTAEDITNKIQAQQREDQIKGIEQAYNLFMQAPVAIHIIKGPDLIIELANKPTLTLWGKGEEVIGKPLEEALPEIKGKGFVELLNEVKETGRVHEAYEAPVFLVRNGITEEVYVNFVFQPYYEERKKTAQAVLVVASEVTERVLIKKQLAEREQRLKESAEKFRTLLEAIPQMTWTNTPEGDVNFYNPGWHQYTGMDYGQTKGWDWKELVHPDDLSIILKNYTEALQTGNSYVNESRFKRADGEYRWHLNRALPIRNEDGEIVLWVGTATDIHERKQVEKAVLESENYFRQLTDTVPAIIWMTDPDGNCTYLNRQWYDYTGQTEEEAQGLGWLNATHPDDKAATAKCFIEANENKGPFSALYRLRSKEGSYRWAIDKGSPRLSANGVYEGMIGTVVDVHDQKLAEIEKRKLISLVEGSPEFIGMAAPDTSIQYVNPAALAMLGWESIEGKTIQDCIYPDDLPLAEKILSQLITEGNSSREIRFVNAKSGDPLWLQWNAVTIKDAALNEVIGLGIVSPNITARKQAEAALLQSEQQIRSLVESAPFPIGVYTGKEMRIELANQAIMNAWGKGNNVLGKLFTDVLPELDNQEIFSQLAGVFTTGIPYHAQNQRVDLVIDNKLQPYYFNYSFTPLHNASGQVYGIMNTAADVTDLNIAKQKAEESERNLRTIILQAPVAMCILKEPDFRVDIANDRMFEIWGRSSEEMLHKPLFEGLPEAKEQGFEVLLQQVYTTGETFTAFEMPVELPRGGKVEMVYLNFVYEPFYEVQGDIAGIMAVAIDVTPQVIARKKIEESEKEFRDVADSLPEMVWTTDSKGVQIFASKRWKEYTGLDPYNVTTFKEMVHPDDWEGIMLAWSDALQTGKTYKTEVRLKSKEDQYQWFYVNGEPIKKENDEIEKWVGAFTNINEQKKAAENLKLISERFRLLADAMPQFVWTADVAGHFNYYNKAVHEYSGLTLDEIQHDGLMKIVHPDEREISINQWKQAVATGNDFALEHRFRRYDGEYRWQLSRAIPQREASGSIRMWVGTSTDIQQIIELDEQKDYFISLASHELKTPITSIKGYIQILQSRYNSQDDIFLKSALSKVNKQIGKMTKLISDLLDVPKIKSGKLILNKEAFLIGQLVQDTVEEVKHLHPNYTIHFVDKIAALVYADKERIGQVMINLLTNAIKYSPNSEEVKVTCTVAGNEVLISIKDYGIGINKNDQQKIFERFYRVEGRNENTYPGFGIGLFIASEIIQRHNGEIGVHSEPGQGSVFYFTLPASLVS